jgi:hypothetical protein
MSIAFSGEKPARSSGSSFDRVRSGNQLKDGKINRENIFENRVLHTRREIQPIFEPGLPLEAN